MKVAVFLAEGFEEIEALTVVDILRRAEVACDMVSLGDIYVNGAHSILVKADKVFSNEANSYDAIVLPGGMPGSKNLRDDDRIIQLVQRFNKEGKLISAICAAPIVLAKANVIKGVKVTSFPSFKSELEGAIYLEEKVVCDGNILTSRGPSTAIEFSYKLLEKLGSNKVEELREGMLYNFLMK